MPSDRLVGLIERLREDAAMLVTSEEATKQGIILPIVGHLGWDRDNVREVVPEHRVGGGRVDYCLRLDHRNAVFIEAKRSGDELERHQEQLLDYAFREGVELATLTNGILWWLYLPLLEGSWEQRKFFTIDLSQQDPKVAASHFERFLSKATVEDGSAVREAKSLQRSKVKARLATSTLPKAWQDLCEEPDELLVELVSEKVEGLCGHRPSADQVAEFLAEAVSGRRGEIPKPTPPKVRPKKGSTKQNRRTPGFTFSRPRAVRLFGNEVKTSTWKEVLVAVCELVHDREATNFDEVLQLRGRSREYFSKDYRGMRSPEHIPGTDIYVETHMSANDIAKRCRQVLELFGYSRDLLVIEAD